MLHCGKRRILSHFYLIMVMKSQLLLTRVVVPDSPLQVRTRERKSLAALIFQDLCPASSSPWLLGNPRRSVGIAGMWSFLVDSKVVNRVSVSDCFQQ